MTNLDAMLDGNKKFAEKQVVAGTLMPSLPAAVPHLKAIVIACADMRVDPAEVLALGPGDALILRNIGGRITPVLLEELRILGRIGQVDHVIPGGGGEFHLIVLQHTDCGITRLTGDSAMLAHYFEIDVQEVERKAVADPRAATLMDVAALRAVPSLPAKWLVSGLLYDVATGLIEVLVPPAAIR